MNKLIFLFAILLALGLSSCVLTNNTHFNSDMSGNTDISLDMNKFISQMNTMMEEEGNKEELEKEIDFENLIDSMLFEGRREIIEDSLQQVLPERGIRNFTMDVVDNVLQVNYNFDNVDAANYNFLEGLIAQDQMQGTEMEYAKFHWDGKYLSYIMDGEPAEDDMGMDMMAEMFEVNSNLSFDNKIKDIETEIDYTLNKNTITFNYTVEQLFQPGTHYKIRLKKPCFSFLRKKK